MNATVRVLRALPVLAASLMAVATPASGQEIGAQIGAIVRPDTVRVGDPFHIVVGIRVPPGATVEFPNRVDSASAVQSLDPPVVTTVQDKAGVRQNADYRVAAWNIGQQPIRFGDVVVHLGQLQRRVQIAGYSVFVRSVLPVDSAKRVPKPARPLLEPSKIPWWIWALLAAAVIAAVLLWWWWRNRARPDVTLVVLDAYEQATREFLRVDGLGLVESGERGRYVALMVEVMRAYLAERVPGASMSLTSTELLSATQSVDTVPHDRLLRVLNETDLVKFAKRTVSLERARELGQESRAIVTAEHVASQPKVEAAA